MTGTQRKEYIKELSLDIYSRLIQIEKAIFLDPNSALIKQRQYVEYLIFLISKNENISFPDDRLKYKLDLLLDMGIIDRYTFEIFDEIRTVGNDAVHRDFSDITINKVLLDKIWNVTYNIFCKYSKSDNMLFVDNALITQTNVKTLDFSKNTRYFFHNIKDNFTYEFSSINIIDYSSDKIASDLERDIFETEEEYSERINKTQLYPIGMIKIMDFVENVNFPVLAQLDTSLGIEYPNIEGFFINTSFNITSGTYTLLANLIYHHSRMYIDINNVYVKASKELVSVKLLSLSIQDNENIEDYINRIDDFGNIIIGTASIKKEIYNINTEELFMDLSILNSFQHYIDNYTEAKIVVDRASAKSICDNSKGYLIFAKISFENKSPRIDDYYLIHNSKKIDILIQKRKNLNICSAKVKLHEKWGFINNNGNMLVSPKYFELDNFYDNMLRVKVNNCWGYIDKSGNEVISPEYEEAWNFYDSRAIVKKDNKYFAIDKENNIINKVKYDSMQNFNENLCVIERNSKYGFMDINGNEVIPCIYDNARQFSNGYAAVKLNSKWGYINKYNKFIVKPQYESCSNWIGSFSIVESNNMYGCITIDSQFIIPPIYDSLDFVDDNTFFAKKNEKFGIIDMFNNTILDFQYDWPFRLGNNYVAIRKDNKVGIVDYKGNLIVDCIYDHIGDFSEGLFPVYINDKGGFINTKGEVVIPIMFEYCYPFNEGLAAVQLNEKYGYIDNKGNILIPLKFQRALNFSNGLAPVQNDYMWGFINKSGYEVIKCQFESVGYFY